MTRTDISDSLIHFTGPRDDQESAYQHLKSILLAQQITAGTNLIKGHYPCVCFTEAPFPSLEEGLLNPDNYSRYAPFGVMFQKAWVFEKGGRPVIYQTDEEYSALPESLRWRHVRYEPTADPPIDFTWEREWRIHCPTLHFGTSKAKIIVPSRRWRIRLISEHDQEQNHKVYMYSQIMDEQVAQMVFHEHFPWTVLALQP
jgi:hypothetical protein